MKRVRPGETVPVIVRLQDRVDVRPMDVPTREKGPRRAVARAAMIKSLKERANRSRQPLQNVLQRHGVVKQRDLWLINAVAVDATPDLIAELMLLPGVASIVVDAVVELPEAEALEISGPAQPNVDLVNAPELWALGYAGQDVTVAIVDSGVDVNHPDLAPAWRGGPNSWFDPNGEHLLEPVDVDGHGTQVAGLVLGGQNSGQYLGVAPAAQWIGVKIFDDSGLAPRSSIHAGYQWLLDPDNNPDTDDAPDIVNNSWGFESTPDVCDATALEFQTDLKVLRAAGIAVVFAAGNTGPEQSSSTPPANYPESFAVGSVGTLSASTLISDFSARGPSACDNTIYPELVAPGFLVWTTDLTDAAGEESSDSYTHVAGTSFATPHVSGVMALLLSAFPGLPLDELEQALTQSATDLGDTGPDNSYGFGLVDALATYRLLENQTGLIGLLVAGLLHRRHRWAALLLVAAFLMSLAACGGGGGGDDPAAVDNSPILAGTESLTISGLTPGMTYYWKMIARDSRGAESESSVWSFQVR
ncbi:MAG: S8 family serine peptidase [Desulfuromonadales bacterium]